MTLFVFIVAVLLVGLFIVVEVSHKPVLALFVKGFASFGFISVWIAVMVSKFFLEGTSIRDLFISALPMAFLFLAGLVCGLLGDVYLELRSLRPKKEEPGIILGGVIFFALGHIVYYVALLLIGQFSFWAILFSLAVTVLLVFAAKWMKMDWEKSKVPCTIYSFLIFLMIGQAFANAIASGFTTMTAVMFSGAVLFGISDLILSQIYFKGQNENKLFIILNLSTYYLAQLLIAVSLYFIY